MASSFDREKNTNLKDSWDLADRAFKLVQWTAFLSLLELAAQKTDSKLIGLISFLLRIPLASLLGKMSAYFFVKRSITKADFKGLAILSALLPIVLILLALLLIGYFLQAVLADFTEFQRRK